MASILEQTVVGNNSKNEEAKHLAEQARTRKARQKQELTLQRRSILAQTANQPARHAALEAALAQIDGQIAQLG
jgi:Rad3-related DNA helicase